VTEEQQQAAGAAARCVRVTIMSTDSHGRLGGTGHRHRTHAREGRYREVQGRKLRCRERAGGVHRDRGPQARLARADGALISLTCARRGLAHDGNRSSRRRAHPCFARGRCGGTQRQCAASPSAERRAPGSPTLRRLRAAHRCAREIERCACLLDLRFRRDHHNHLPAHDFGWRVEHSELL